MLPQLLSYLVLAASLSGSPLGLVPAESRLPSVESWETQLHRVPDLGGVGSAASSCQLENRRGKLDGSSLTSPGARLSRRESEVLGAS